MATVTPSDVAATALELARSRPPTLGSGRLICVDGPAGSGKTTLAAAISAQAGAHVVHMDALYDGWEGLPRVSDQLDALLLPLAADEDGHYLRYDWDLEQYVETVTVRPAPLLVLEGVGSGSLAHAGRCTLLVWVEAPADLRLRRGLERDGVHLEHRFRQWMRDETEHFTREGTLARADLLVDGSGLRQPPTHWDD
ncbi:MAG: (d)CMP kinase [Nocardioides sp.]|nr:(d)CMP kinase [Nocardioides sp.]